MDLYYLRRYSSEYLDLSGEVHRFDAAREIHEKLSILLGGEKRTFFDQPEEEVKEGADGVPIDLQQLPSIDNVRLTSLDIVAWSYLKEELVNTADSKEVKFLKESFPNLVKFVSFMDDFLTKSPSTEKTKILLWNGSDDMAHKIVNSL